MAKSICGANCDQCPMRENCSGCIKTKGKPFGGKCVLAECCLGKKLKRCEQCRSAEGSCCKKMELLKEINSLKVNGMPKVKELFALNGSFVNMEYRLPNGQKVKLLNDNDIYLGNQLPKKDSDRCYGIAANNSHILVCEYGENGTTPEIIIYKKR